MTRMYWKAALLSTFALAAVAQQRAVALISIDGMRPDHVLQADRHGLKIPNLRRMLREGAHATAMRGTPGAAFWVDMKTNFAIGSALAGPLAQAVAVHGTHGYAPTHPELQASFLIVGPDIRKGLDLGNIEMRNVAPTLAKLLGIAFPSAALPALPVL